MVDVQLCINEYHGFDAPLSERLAAIRRAGFDGFFAGWKPGKAGEYVREGKWAGLFVQSLHAPFADVPGLLPGVMVDSMWKEGPDGDRYLSMLRDCVTDCAQSSIPLLVVHAIIGFDQHTPTDLGMERFDALCRHADERGVLLGFENTEGDEYLARIMKELSHHPACQFVWDSGHEMCYNGSRDQLALYGERLAGTHLNDNLAVTGEEITWLDDAHLLPLDGVGDWRANMARLSRYAFSRPLTFEVTALNRPGRHTHDRYAGWNMQTFLNEAHTRAVQLADMQQLAAKCKETQQFVQKKGADSLIDA